MSASGGPGAACWRCIHCGFLIPGLEPGTLECCPIPACKKKQQENTVQAEGAVAGGSALEAKQLPSKGSSSPSIKRTKVTSNGNFDDNDLTRTYRASSMVSELDNGSVRVVSSGSDEKKGKKMTVKRTPDWVEVLEFEGKVELSPSAWRPHEGVNYMYFVQTSEARYGEFLYGAPGGGQNKDRCLKLPKAVEGGKSYHQYDSMAFPETKKKIKFMKGSMKFIVGHKTAENEMVIPDHESMQTAALAIYLHGYKNKLCKMDMTIISNAEFMSTNIELIYRKLSNSIIGATDENYRGTRQITWPCKELSTVILNYFFEIVETLYQCDVQQNALLNGKRMASALTILCCFNRIVLKLDSIPLEHIVALLSMLHLMPDSKKLQCADWDHVSSLLPETLKGRALDAVHRCVVHLSHQKHFDPVWLFALPVVHFLKGSSRPFQPIECNPRNIPWGDKFIGSGFVKNLIKDKELSNLDEILAKLKPLIALDPLVIYCFMYIMPRNHLSKLFPDILPYFSLAYMASHFFKKSISADEAEETTKDIATIIQKYLESSKKIDYELWKSTFDASIFLLQELLKVRNTAETFIRLMTQVIELVIECSATVEVFRGQKNVELEIEHTISPAFYKVSTSLGEYIRNVFGKPFGLGGWRGQRWTQSQAESEIKVWDSIIISKFEGVEVSVRWNSEVIVKIMKSRVQRLNLENRIDLFVSLESVPNCHNIIVNTFMDAIMEKINDMSTGDVESLISRSSSQEKNVGKIVDKIMAEHYNGISDQITFEDLMDWPMWQTFMKIFNSQEASKFIKFISETCIELFTHANGMLDEIHTKIVDGTMSLRELLLMKNERDHVKKLLTASIHDEQKVKQVQQTLEEKFRECALFLDRKKHLGQLCRHVKVPVKGLGELKAAIVADQHDTPINELWKFEHGKIEYLSLQSAIPLDEIALNFDTMFRKFSTNLIHAIWEAHMNAASQKCKELMIMDIKHKIWEPTFRECLNLLESLHDRSIKLVDVDRHFSKIKEKEKELRCLNDGVTMCCNLKKNQNLDWIHTAVNLMKEYWTLLSLAEAARILISLKDRLSLSGDFSLIQTIAEEVVQSIGDRSLNSIDEKFIVAGGFLKKFMNEPGKLECLKAFADSLDIVEWILKETKDVNDLHKFVTVALHTAAGEGDFANDNLSMLKIVGSGYGPLIYNLQDNPNFDNFKACCQQVWEALEQNSNLPQFLRFCNNDVQWYKSVKETQGSVEVTSYSQMDNIFEYGCYIVGVKQPAIGECHDDVIYLQLKEEGLDRCLTKKKYNLEELRDLESKLVLITGSKTENRRKVELFVNTLQSVCRIAEVLLSLQQAGNVEYTGWIYLVPCSTSEEIVSILQTRANTMECELQKWNEAVFKARQMFYELNYFTTVQLLTLRQQLGTLNVTQNVPPSVLALLQSISSEVQSESICRVVREVSCIPETPNIEENERPMKTPPSGDSASIFEIGMDRLWPTLREQDLSPDQKSTMSFVVQRLGCSNMLVLKAFEECRGEDMNRYRYLEWCNEHIDIYTFEEDVIHSDDCDNMPLESKQEESAELSGPTRLSDLLAPNRTSKTMLSLDSSPSQKTSDLLTSQKVRTPVHDEQHILEESNVERSEQDEMNWNSGGPPTVSADSQAIGRYLDLEQLGKVLQRVMPGEVQEQRSFLHIKSLKYGQPNLLVVPHDQVLRTALYVYMDNYGHSLPTLEEVLICYPFTTAEEVELFWMRAINERSYQRIFCLVHAEKLSYQVSDLALTSLSKYSQERNNYRIVIICSNVEENSYFISKLHLFKRQFVPPIDLAEFKQYLSRHFTQKSRKPCKLASHSSVVEKSCVGIISSYRSGMGKSLYITALAEKLKNENPECDLITIPLHGPVVTPDIVLELFKDHFEKPTCCIYHIDIAPNILHEVDTILFSLLILRGLNDSQGRVWRCHPSQLYAVEVTLPKKGPPSEVIAILPESRTLALLEMLPTITCVSPAETLDHLPMKNIALMADRLRSMPYQRVFHYIKKYTATSAKSKKKTSTCDENFSYKAQVKKDGSTIECLKAIIDHCGVKDPSWSEIHHFVNFLDRQLQSCEASDFLNPKLVGDIMEGAKNFIIKFMIRMSRDFSTSSLCGEVAVEMSEVLVEDNLDMYQINARKIWEQSPHPYILFNEDKISLTFIGFMVSEAGDLYTKALDSGDYIRECNNIMTPKLYDGFKQNQVDFNDDYSKWTQHMMIMKLCTVMGVKKHQQEDEDGFQDLDESYVLTADNVTKILAIQMRFRCGIPVVIMGETGCGKTRLIRYMCDLARHGLKVNNLLILKVHGGTTEKDIYKFIKQAENEVLKNRLADMDTVVFFDEANTTNAIGLIKEIMCDHRINGKPVSEDLKFIAACNPYRKHTEEMITRLETAGLGFFFKDSDLKADQKLGKIPLRQLVYRVLDLPPSMRPLVYDFGQLNRDVECSYIERIVNDHIQNHDKLSKELERIKNPVRDTLAWSQMYMREMKDECSFVSLRDVERAMVVFKYMYGMMDVFGPLMDHWAEKKLATHAAEDGSKEVPKYKSPGPVARALVLALSVCYHARLQRREDFENGVVGAFTGPITLPGGAQQFRDEIRWCQEVLLDSMHLGENIARNAALRENVFMMVVCVELRIPLFLVGKPGSSKSLAKSIISESMKGRNSSNVLLKKFKEVGIFSYQCSQLSTSESVIEVFHNASNFQKIHDDILSYVTVVVLDEVGLAEDSPNLPLKALHPLLEDGTEGTRNDFYDEIIDREERVAFIGLSNWALDPAKMNRGVMVTRGDPSEQELIFSAKGICSNKENDRIRSKLESFFEPLAKAYINICKKQEREFYGLRDFYSLIKMLYYMCEKTDRHPTWPQIEHAIKRNFGGLEPETWNPYDEFTKQIQMSREPPDLTNIEKELHLFLHPDCSRLGLIQTCLSSDEKTWHGENRYVLFLTENYAALDVLKNPENYMSDEMRMSMPDATSNMRPFILFGSSFPKDKEYTQVCQNINRIKICMETGRTVILLNLENLYESLYDVLNQYYIYHADNRYVDLGLQSHRVKCRVDNNFKLILIAEKDTVYDKFPTPLINRLEKHFVLTSSILKKWQENVLNTFKDWIERFTNTRTSTFEKSDAFIGFQDDTPASVVFQATNLLRTACAATKKGHVTKKGKWADIFKWSKLERRDCYIEENEQQALWEEAVLNLSKHLLLQIATPEAIVRLKHSDLAHVKGEVEQIYFEQQCHHSVEAFFNRYMKETYWEDGALMQVTTHSHLLSQGELRCVEEAINIRVVAFFLSEFDTELDFINKVGLTFQLSGDSPPEKRLVIIQCDSGRMTGDLIACARYHVCELKAKATKELTTHVLFVIHLPRNATNSSFVGFQGDPWVSFHIDDLRPTNDVIASVGDAIGMTMSELFLGNTSSMARMETEEEESDDEDYLDTTATSEYPGDISSPEPSEVGVVSFAVDAESLPIETACFGRLHDCIQAAASKLKDTNKRCTQRVTILVQLIPKEAPNVQDSANSAQFCEVLVRHIHKVLLEHDEVREDKKDWVSSEAMNVKSLQYGGTFRNVLSRKVDEVVIPIFSEIIAVVDQNYNLNLINPRDESSPQSQFWLNMFRDSSIMQFNYTDMIAPKECVPGLGGRKTREDFKSEFPFSWLVFEAVESQMDNAKSSAGNSDLQLYRQLCAALKPTSVCDVVNKVEAGDYEDFFFRYLHDFVRLVHKCDYQDMVHENREYLLISNALNALVCEDAFGSSANERMSLLQCIAALHVLFHKYRSEILWFGQLVGHSPGIMVHLTMDMIKNEEEMILHFCAVEIALESLSEPLKIGEDVPDDNLIPWLNEVHTYQNAINSILSSPSQNDIKLQAEQKWEAIRVLQLFLEHVLLKHEFKNKVSYLNRLIVSLDFKANLLETSTLKLVHTHLERTENEVLRKKLIKGRIESEVFLSHCNNYFMEVVSTLCFGRRSAPEPDLITMLMTMMFVERCGVISPTARKLDAVPVITSSLLQLLLEHNSESVKQYLADYYSRSQKALVGGSESLCLLCIQCFEDALYKRHAYQDTEMKFESCIEILANAHPTLRKYKSNPSINISYLEGVAGTKFAIMEVANFIHSQFSNDENLDIDQTFEQSEVVSTLMEWARRVCTDTVINTTTMKSGNVDITGPVAYLLKLLVRHFSFPCLKQASEKYLWIVPQGLRTSNLEKVMDPFVIYDNTIGYSSLREKICDILYHKKRLDKFLNIIKDFAAMKLATLLLAIYETITLGYSNPKRSIDSDLLHAFDNFLLDLIHLEPLMLKIAKLFLRNEQGSPLPQMRLQPSLTPECKTLGAIIVHTATVLSANSKQPLLLPLVNMLINPAILHNAYLPTMVDDNFTEITEAFKSDGVKFYVCSKGHRYLIGECGYPQERGRCNICGDKIGGKHYKLAPGNTEGRSDDSTQIGHILGRAKLRTSTPAPERNLQPPAICILRAIMHSAFLMCSCHNSDALPELAKLVKPAVNPQQLPEFFWMHLRKDIEHLSRVTGEGMEESAIIVHLVLQDMLSTNDNDDNIESVNLLGCKEDREKWEEAFNQRYIWPILSRLEAHLDAARLVLTNDDTQGQDKLFRIVYERNKVKKKGLDPHLWSYRQRVSLEHLGLTLLDVKLKEKYPILHEFLRVETSLRATQYLPDIVKLQRSLYDVFHHRLDRKDAETQTIGGFYEYLRTKRRNNACNEYRDRLESLKEAWILVGQNLKNHGRFPLEEKHCLPVITRDVPIKYLIPTTSGAGLLTTSLVDYLIQTHNEFINRCYSIVTERGDLCDWFCQKVPIRHVHQCHLLDYEHQIVSVVLSHCRYSLKLGEAHTVQYDHQALEKHILDKFVYGRPEIVREDTLQVMYRKDIYTTVTFNQVRKKVKPQVQLEFQAQKAIVNELRTPDLLRESLDVIDIVLGFLSSGGGKADTPLGEYIHGVLKMEKPFNEKAEEYCRLKHVLSLWEALSVELARQTYLQKREPFDSLDEKYLCPLTTDADDDQGAALTKCLRMFNLDRLLGALFEFIETYVRTSPDSNLKWPLKEVITADQFQHLEIEKHFYDEFPESITLDQTVDVWKHIVAYQKS